MEAEEKVRRAMPKDDDAPEGVRQDMDGTPQPVGQDDRADEAGNTPLPEPDVDAGGMMGTVSTSADVEAPAQQPPAQNSEAHVHTDGGADDPAAK